MTYTPILASQIIEAIAVAINQNADEVTKLDQAIGDGDHVINLQRGIQALMAQRDGLSKLEWAAAWQKIGSTLMATVGGASGSLLGTLFVAMAKSAVGHPLDFQGFATAFAQGVAAMKLRGKSDVGEKTMLDVLVPVAEYLQVAASHSLAMEEVLVETGNVAIEGMEATRDMLATKGRASFLEERSRGHIDAGAKTCQLMVCAICAVLSATPA